MPQFDPRIDPARRDKNELILLEFATTLLRYNVAYTPDELMGKATEYAIAFIKQLPDYRKATKGL